MADDEQFSLCWNNFNSNLSAGFHESLVRGDLVDVTLAAEGQFVKAHRLVLSVCSPYFRKMFTQMPANQHAFVFLKDVSHSALKDLIQFMYCGEVNVKQDALPVFISTAEALQIKGLTDSDPAPAQSPAEVPAPTPPQIQQIAPSPRVRQTQRVTSQKYKVETVDDPSDDHRQTTQIVIQTAAPPQATTIAQPVHHHVQQTHQQQQIGSAGSTSTAVVHRTTTKRTGGTIGHQVKRTKSTIDPLDTQDSGTTTAQQITVQTAVIDHPRGQQSEPEYIDLPIELPTKAEPDYSEDAAEVESGDQDGNYVEDDAYADFQNRYDENYFTENEDAGNVTAGASGDSTTGGNTPGATTSKAMIKQQLGDASYVESADQSTTDAQDSTVLTFDYVNTGYRLDITLPDESFLKREANKRMLKNVNDMVKSGLSSRVPAFLENRTLDDWGKIKYANTTRGNQILFYGEHRFIKNNIYGATIYWKCSKWHSNCRARAITNTDDPTRVIIKGAHNHELNKSDDYE